MVKETFDIQFIIESIPKLITALPLTLFIAFMALLLGLPLALLAAWGKISGPKIVKVILRVFTDLIRGIPTVVLLYILYFGLPIWVYALSGVNINSWAKWVFVVIALAIDITANNSEMFRSAYTSIERGQIEAAHSLGYTQLQRFIHVLLPQGLYVILPNLGSSVLAIIQATALVYTLGIFDLLGKARQIDTNVSHVKTFEMYFICAIIYWLIALLMDRLFKVFEKKLSKGFKTVTNTN